MFRQRKIDKDEKIINLFSDVQLYILQPLNNNVELNEVVTEIKKRVPYGFFRGVDCIYITHLKEFDERKINAMAKDGAIYVTNRQDSVKDIVDDIIHEIAHIVEENSYEEVYGNGELENEFLKKREILFQRLEDKLNPKKNWQDLFFSSEFSQELDDFFYKELGYENLQKYCKDLFVSPYGVTSLREYWANGFEHYFLGLRKELLNSSPNLFEKISRMEKKRKNWGVR